MIGRSLGSKKSAKRILWARSAEAPRTALESDKLANAIDGEWTES